METYGLNASNDAVDDDDISVRGMLVSTVIDDLYFLDWYFNLILDYDFPAGGGHKTCDTQFPTVIVTTAAIIGFFIGFGGLCCCICCGVACRSMQVSYRTRKRVRKQTLVKAMVQRYDTKKIELAAAEIEKEASESIKRELQNTKLHKTAVNGEIKNAKNEKEDKSKSDNKEKEDSSSKSKSK